MKFALIFGVFLLGIGYAPASHGHSPQVEVLVNGVPLHEYFHQGTTYLEAVRGQEYAIRITNPIGARVAVALSVDGLNTIDARHTDARSARKWVLGPYESVVISGWQTNARQARRFFFTTEERSYGSWLGKTENLGIINASFFREKTYCAQQSLAEPPGVPRPLGGDSPAASEDRARKDAAGDAGLKSQRGETSAAAPAPQADYAATGIGDRMRHEVQWVHMDLEDRPFAAVRLRYEFRPALVKLGVFPPMSTDDPLTRRQHARGFRDADYCPEP